MNSIPYKTKEAVGALQLERRRPQQIFKRARNRKPTTFIPESNPARAASVKELVCHTQEARTNQAHPFQMPPGCLRLDNNEMMNDE
jgi:hypothetical protein